MGAGYYYTATATTYPSPIVLVDGVEGILNCHPLHVFRCDLDAEREMEVDLVNRRRSQEHAQDGWVVNLGRRGVDLPAQMSAICV